MAHCSYLGNRTLIMYVTYSQILIKPVLVLF